MNKHIYLLFFVGFFLPSATIGFDTLQQYFENNLRNKKICLALNPGNAGDALIWFGTYCLFKDMGIEYITSNNEQDILSSDVVIYSGGGNLVPYYNYCTQFLKKYIHKVKKLLILPHTIQGNYDLLKQLPGHIDIFCREQMSYTYCKKIVPHPDNVYFSDDLAFYADLSDFKRNFTMPTQNTSKDLFAFRMDPEKNNERKDVILPKNNIDISKLGFIRPGDSVEKCLQTTYNFLSRIMPYATIWTDRLHVGIAGFLLGKKVHLFDNSYGKNKAVYEASIKPRDAHKLVSFHGQNFKPLQEKLHRNSL